MKRVLVVSLALSCAWVFAPPAQASLRVRSRIPVPGDANAVAVGADGSVYVVGSRPVPGARFRPEAVLTKVTPAGSRVWARVWHPAGVTAVATAVAVDADGRVYESGTLNRRRDAAGSWFVRTYGPKGRGLRAYVAPWQLSVFTTVSDIAVRDGQVVVAQTDDGCCESWEENGWIRAVDARLRPSWSAPFVSTRGDPVTGVSIDAFGNVLAAGWKATGWSDHGGGAPIAGTLFVEKLTSGGTTLWRRRPGVPTPGYGVVSLSARGDRLMVSAPMRSKGVWLGRFTFGGGLVWSRTWGTDRRRAQAPFAVAVDASGSTWVVGSREHPKDSRQDGFVRVIGQGGGVAGTLLLHDANALGVAACKDGAYVAAVDLWRISG